MKERKRFLLYYDWENLIQDMSDSDIASLTRWIFKYQNTWEISDMTYWAKLAFSFMRPVFDEDRKDWEEVREVRRKAWSEWGKAKASKLKQNVANASTTKHDIAVIGIDSVSGIDIVIDTDMLETDTVVSQPNEYQLSISYLKENREKVFTQELQIPEYAEDEWEWHRFVWYWSELSKSGKLKAEWEKTFEIKRRFATWMSRKKETYQQKQKESALDITL